MQFSQEVERMTCVAKGPNHGPAAIPEEGRWVQAKQIADISGFTHGVGVRLNKVVVNYPSTSKKGLSKKRWWKHSDVLE